MAPTGRWLPRLLSRIWLRLLAFNLLLVFLPVIGIFTLESYESNLLIWQERSMVQQGRLLAAALAAADAEQLDGARARHILETMNRHFDARLRVVAPDYRVVADSADLAVPVEEPPAVSDLYRPRDLPATAATEADLRDNPVYRLGNFVYDLYARAFLPPDPVLGRSIEVVDGRLELPEVGVALRGGYGSATRLSGTKRSLTLSSALPIRRDEHSQVVGAVLVSKSTFQILSTLYQLRIETFAVVLWSLLAAILLTLFMAGTIARPISRLVQQSALLLDRRGRLRGLFQPSQRRDEIGDLSRALAELTRRLEGHLRFIESFAADVSHELKNPLASIRNAADLLRQLEGDGQDETASRRRFLQMIQQDVARLERLIQGIREVSRLDADLAALPVEKVALTSLLRRYAEGLAVRAPDTPLELQAPEQEVWVAASPDRLVQVLDNLVDNARSFAPAGSPLELALKADGGEAVLQIADRGPGIPPEHLEKIFERFFSYRPGQPAGHHGHTGLGLAIVKAIVEGYGGSIRAAARPDGGALFELRLPASRA